MRSGPTAGGTATAGPAAGAPRFRSPSFRFARCPLHAIMRSDRDSAEAAAAATEFFLKHRLYLRVRDGSAHVAVRSKTAALVAPSVRRTFTQPSLRLWLGRP
jgi:hypothetical protein